MSRMLKWTTPLLALGFSAGACWAADAEPEKQKNFAVAPIVSSSPSFGTGLGATSSYLYQTPTGDRPSQVLAAFQYSNTDSYSAFARNQAYWAGDNKRATTAAGLIRVRNDFDGAEFDTKAILAFHRQHWRITDHWLLGFNATAILSEYSARNALGQGFIAATGASDNDVFGLGLSAEYDTRDNHFYPYSGSLFQVNTFSYMDALGSDEDYDVYEVSYGKYLPMAEYDVLALGFFGRYVSDDAPYSGESYLGRRSYLRGFNAGEASGTDLTGVQAEYRYYISDTWKLVGFAGAVDLRGGSAEDRNQEDVYYSAGVGLRYAIQPASRVHLRFDIAAGNDDNQGFYIGLQEAF
ncbi:MAG: hypothetical protein AseanaTS_06920 [Candidatus Pelagadaptatus aseana]|uniref:BamA/TamA family outer membrane protein n=1 Tax=Candidatus Pelagadaptatus aseana TaxID=3120508 RepID=UPI0039B2B591